MDRDLWSGARLGLGARVTSIPAGCGAAGPWPWARRHGWVPATPVSRERPQASGVSVPGALHSCRWPGRSGYLQA